MKEVSCIKQIETILYAKPVNQIVKERYSCRAYKEDINDNILKLLRKDCSLINEGFYGEKIKFEIVDKKKSFGIRAMIGTYGMILNPRFFIVGSISDSDKAYESYGYALEHLVLKAIDLGIQTCWLGYFNRNFFETEFPLDKEDIIPAISAIGFDSKKHGIWDTISKLIKKPRERRPFEELFFENNFGNPLKREISGRYTECLEMIRLAPSAGNRQPWRVIKDKNSDTFHFYMDPRETNKREGYKLRRLAEIDIGIAMCHFELLAKEKKLKGKWEINNPNIPLPAEVSYRISWVSLD